eukprot:CAMPEP_0178398778 /NCGR_PEP_ID=MMETSP0689_2-20121128/14945_1 /TAXON_ID=160604 /ORGANISM="Amphidinium massartii, Strain CS-259" /LENGTH=78 /DNA_ID=CAMNT_0020019545 /DNA_START=97 /DNA_END=333 /DNA_ORIENTATION=-
MPHVFMDDEDCFVQVHYQHLPPRPTGKVFSRNRNAEYTKYLLEQECTEEELKKLAEMKAKRAAKEKEKRAKAKEEEDE